MSETVEAACLVRRLKVELGMFWEEFSIEMEGKVGIPTLYAGRAKELIHEINLSFRHVNTLSMVPLVTPRR